MNELTALLQAEIDRHGPIPFDRFMDAALYHPVYGYYRSGREVFGRAGDFYTAEQMQPVFGILIAQALRTLWMELGLPSAFQVVELGAGRAEMAEFLSDFRYTPVDVNRGALPASMDGVVFANEFFDALPVKVFRMTADGYRELLVAWEDERFTWVEGGPPSGACLKYLASYCHSPDAGALVEVNLAALDWLERISSSVGNGFLFAIDYGYTRREMIRFPRGTLMSYRRHQATEDVLVEPGGRDITAHVNFTALLEHAAGAGWECVRFESMAQALLRAGEPDQFAAALASGDEVEAVRRRLQLKSLVFGMGETFRTVLLKKVGPK